jgi:hypothetical protein
MDIIPVLFFVKEPWFTLFFMQDSTGAAFLSGSRCEARPAPGGQVSGLLPLRGGSEDTSHRFEHDPSLMQAVSIAVNPRRRWRHSGGSASHRDLFETMKSPIRKESREWSNV